MSTVITGTDITVDNVVANTGVDSPSVAIDGSEVSPFGFRNKIINGEFDIWQRGSQNNPTAWSGADRWLTRNIANIGGTSSYVKLTDAISGKNYIKIDNNGATSKSNYLVQRVEGLNHVGTHTLSVKRGEVTGTIDAFNIVVNRNYGTGGTPSAQDTIVASIAFNYNAATDRYEYTFEIPDLSGKTLGTNNDGYIEVWLSWSWTSTDFTMRIYEVQLEEGSIATPFEQRPIGLELSLCQRYFTILNNEGLGGSYIHFGIGSAYSTTAAEITPPLKTSMRANPTVTSGGAMIIRGSGSNISVTSIAIGQQCTPSNVILSVSVASGLVANECYRVSGNADTSAYIALDAEL